ncbi:MAG: hypothetical protein LLF94_12335, partial [Chlamydiales bacterium]|nr:hypothetical protein [Chlamydiales bacterium]
MPTHRISQNTFASKVASASRLCPVQTKWLEKVYQGSGIHYRYSVLEDFTKEAADWTFWLQDTPASTHARNELYKL